MIELTIVPRQLQVVEGGMARATATVRIVDPEPVTVRLTIEGPQAAWSTIDQPEITIPPGGAVQAAITLHPPIGVATGEHVLVVVAINTTKPDEPTRDTATIHVDGKDRDALAAAAAIATAPANRSFRLNPRMLVPALVLLLIVLGAGTVLVLRNRSSHAISIACPTGTAAHATVCRGTVTPATSAATRASTPVASPTATPPPSPTARPVSATPTLTARQRYAKYLKPGFPGSPRHHRRHVPTPAASPTKSPSPTITGTPPDTATIGPTVTLTPTVTASETSTPTITSTPTNTGTPTLSPTPSRTLTPSVTLTPSITETPTISPTPAEIGLLYNYAAGPAGIVISWQATFASAFTIDGKAAPLSGTQTFPLRTHVYILSALSLDKTQSRLQAVAVVLSQCRVQVNDQHLNLQNPGCLDGNPLPTATATPAPATVTPTESPTASPRHRAHAGGLPATLSPTARTKAIGTPTATRTP